MLAASTGANVRRGVRSLQKLITLGAPLQQGSPSAENRPPVANGTGPMRDGATMSSIQDSDSDSESFRPIPFEKRSFNVAQTAEILGVSESTVFELLKGPLRSFKAGRARRVTGAAIDAFRAEA